MTAEDLCRRLVSLMGTLQSDPDRPTEVLLLKEYVTAAVKQVLEDYPDQHGYRVSISPRHKRGKQGVDVRIDGTHSPIRITTA